MSNPLSVYLKRLGNLIFSGVLVLLVWGCGPITGQSIPAGGGAVLAETGRVYALVETQDEARLIDASALEFGYTPQEHVDLDGLGLIMVPVDLPDGVTGLEAITALEAAVGGAIVGVNHAYRLQITGAADDGRVYANALTQWPMSGACAAQSAIGLIDGGVDPAASGLQGVTVRTNSFAQASPQSIRHGTEVASVLADPSRLNDVTIYSANVIGTNEAGEDLGGAAQLVQALDWMASQGVGLVNISLAGPPNKLLAQGVRSATARNMVIVAAVGNTGRNAPPQFPAALPDVLAVTAVDARSRIFANAVRGPHVDVAAPGVDIFVPSGDGGRFVSGTSMAAPFVTAVLASQSRRSRNAVVLSARDLGANGKDNTFGNGLIDAGTACR